MQDGNEGNEDEDECDREEGEVAIGNTILDYHFGFPRMDPRSWMSPSSFSVFAGTPSLSSSCLQILGNGLFVPEEGACCSLVVRRTRVGDFTVRNNTTGGNNSCAT